MTETTRPDRSTLNATRTLFSTTTREIAGGTKSNQDDSAFTGGAGLAYLFDSGVAPYVGYATCFSPQLGVGAAGNPFQSTTGEQKEAGVKHQIPNANVLLAAAVFDITQNNVLRTAPECRLPGRDRQVQSQGVGLEATASLAPGVDVTAAYTHLDVEITRGAADTTGNRFSGIPSPPLPNTRSSPVGRLAGLGIGAGVRYIGASDGDDQNTFRNKDVTLVDAVVDYDVAQLNPKPRGLKLQVNATNLFDERYAACQSGYCYAGERQKAIGGLVYRW